MYKSILLISDLHAPYWHRDTVSFLKALKTRYKPDKIISVGDEIDAHSMSFHEHNPDLLSPGKELEKAIELLQTLYTLFPVVDLMESNHGSMVYRRGILSGLPKHVFKSYQDVIAAPKGWRWHSHLVTKMSSGQSLYTCHSKGTDVLRVSQAMGMCVAQGHHHERFELRYWQSEFGLFWGMSVGCMINDAELCYEYNKINLRRPILGHAIILNGVPRLLPMYLNKAGRWTGVVP